jgi:hypothetical protein
MAKSVTGNSGCVELRPRGEHVEHEWQREYKKYRATSTARIILQSVHVKAKLNGTNRIIMCVFVSSLVQVDSSQSR